MEFLKEHMVTKDELQKVQSDVYDIRAGMQNFATKNDYERFASDIINHIDRFAKLHETLDQELVMLRGKYDRLEGRLEVVEAKLGLAGA